jgi:phosphatidylserine/phosphatidylglycerophosphate/cardiolipin synthase-like enzyme
MERKETHFPRSILLGGLAFGLGGVIGYFALYLLIRSQLLSYPLNLVPEGQSLVLLISTIVLLIIGIGITTGIGGTIGGYSLSFIDPIYPRGKYIWRTAISAGVSQAILILPLILLIAIIALYNNGLDRDASGQVIVFGIFGALYGLIFGLILGFSTVGWRQVWRVLLATIIGFGLGGAVTGYGLRLAYYPASLGGTLPDIVIVIPLISFAFFGLGGIFLGWVYEWVTHWRVDNMPHEPARWVKIAGVVAAILIAFFLVSNYRQLIKFLTIQPGSLSSQLSMETIGVHWEGGIEISGNLASNEEGTYSASANEDGHTVAVWMEENQGVSEILLSVKNESGKEWSSAVPVSTNTEFDANHPEIATDLNGSNHIVWSQQTDESLEIFYSFCDGADCNEPQRLSDLKGLVCVGDEEFELVGINDWPVIALNGENDLMVMWSNASGAMIYLTWKNGENPPSTPTGCFTGPQISIDPTDHLHPRVSGGPKTSFHAVFEIGEAGSETVYSMDYFGPDWSTPQSLASGITPDVFITRSDEIYYTWCDANERTQIKSLDSDRVETIEFPSCKSRPVLAENENGELHLVWYSDQVKNNENVVSQASIIYESVRTDQGWSDPAIVVQTENFSGPAIAGRGGGDLTVLWSNNSETKLFSAQQPIYQCTEDSLNNIGQVMLEVSRSGMFRPEGDPIPFCGNQFIGLVYMPNPESAYSPQGPSLNGGFDTMSNLASSVEYEVLFSVMEWASAEGDESDLNPGFVFTNEIAHLYQQIKEDPSRYPRGLTIRILLGNYPEISKLEWGEQIWNVLENLRAAGVDKMVDSDLGWKVEVANFEGVYPHSHTKFMIIDGKTMVASGYNYGYLHFPFDHPSNKGGDLFDLGIVMSGPIAQQALITYDDYWQGGEQLFCPDLSPDPDLLWTRDCIRSVAQATHVPEVMKYFQPKLFDNLSNAFSLNRNINFKESDEVILAVLESAQESLDILEVNFSLELICALDMLNDNICSYENSLDYMEAIMTSVEENQTKVRVLVEKINSNGMENRISAKEFTRELEKRGLSEFVEIKFFEGRMHSKAFLVDDEMLFIGSQNFHYSAFGKQGLAEYNLATDAPRAVDTFKTLFDYYWETGIPWEDYK